MEIFKISTVPSLPAALQSPTSVSTVLFLSQPFSPFSFLITLYCWAISVESVPAVERVCENDLIVSVRTLRSRQFRLSNHKTGLMNDQLSKQTSIFGLRLWVVVGVCVGAAFVLFLFVLSIWLASKRSKRKISKKSTIPIVTKEIQEIRVDNGGFSNQQYQENKPTRAQIQADHHRESDLLPVVEWQSLLSVREDEERPSGYNKIHIEIGKDHRISYPECVAGSSSSHGSGEGRCGTDQVPVVIPEVSHLGWGHWYTLRELEASTNSFADEKVIGEGGYGIVYHGVLEDGTQIAVKNLLNNKGQAEREFKVEVEAIGRVRHKNLVRLVGYCAEGAHRMLVYEYINNGTLEQWLHGDVGSVSPLTWEIRMNIILGTAKGLAYLHEGLEPKVVHRDIKSSNVLLDKQWNPKVSDFGLAKLLTSDHSYVTTRVMGTFGYVAPEYASTGLLNERSDVYGFGILIMEIISGRNPVDYGRPAEEVNLVDWLKRMVSEGKPEEVLDPKLKEKPTTRALKRALLVALRCIDPNAQKRPKMGYVIHMLEAEGATPRNDQKGVRESRAINSISKNDGVKEEESSGMKTAGMHK